LLQSNETGQQSVNLVVWQIDPRRLQDRTGPRLKADSRSRRRISLVLCGGMTMGVLRENEQGPVREDPVDSGTTRLPADGEVRGLAGSLQVQQATFFRRQ